LEEVAAPAADVDALRRPLRVGAADNYVELHAGKSTYLVRETMAQIESKLDPRKFARIHRSAIVNLDRVKEMQTVFSGDHQLTLRDGTRLTVSRTHRDRLLSLLEKP
jgi:two-component system LytT family response regulator